MPDFQKNVSECMAHAWYDGDWTRHPYEEDAVPRYTAVGNPITDSEKPLEVLRTVHAFDFDPCIACAIHTVDFEGRELARVRAL